jgi:hypothetical protein
MEECVKLESSEEETLVTLVYPCLGYIAIIQGIGTLIAGAHGSEARDTIG